MHMTIHSLEKEYLYLYFVIKSSFSGFICLCEIYLLLKSVNDNGNILQISELQFLLTMIFKV